MPGPTSSSKVSTFNRISTDPHVNPLINGVKWGGALGTGVTLTYSFPGSTQASTAWLAGYQEAVSSRLGYLTLDERADVRQALKIWSMYSNVKFVEIGDTLTNVGDLRFAKTTYTTGLDVLAHAYLPDGTARGGDVWILKNKPEMATLDIGSQGFGTVLHEIGHALGLKHPFAGLYTLPPNLMSLENTIMAYGNRAGSVTPAPFDVAAIQYLYGRNMSFNAGNNVYTVESLRSLFGLGTSSVGPVTLWDAGGIDTFVSAAGRVDLRPWIGGRTDVVGDGYYSGFTGGYFGGHSLSVDVQIAKGAIIENATMLETGAEVWGNAYANVLKGRQSGAHLGYTGGQFVGLGGNDTIYGDRVTITAGSTGIGAEGSTLYGGTGDDKLFGFIYGDALYGGAGNDYLQGSTGADWLSGGSGVDTVFYGDSSSAIVLHLSNYVGAQPIAAYDDNREDALVGHLIFMQENTHAIGQGGTAEGDRVVAVENVIGTAYNDDIRGNNVANVIEGRSGNDTIYAMEGNDVVIGGPGNDLLHGMSGNDTVSYADTTIGVNVRLGFGYQDTRHGFDQIYDFENVIGGLGNDTLTGDANPNTLTGLAGGDTLRGGLGNDTLYGGAGRDLLYGEGGTDTFIYRAVSESLRGASRDVIVVFNRAEKDKINMALIDADLTAAAGNQAFKFIGTAAFKGGGGELRFAGGVVQGDINGDRIADIEIQVTGVAGMLASDFIL
jgi:serralysin